jgi:hypothetical protein
MLFAVGSDNHWTECPPPPEKAEMMLHTQIYKYNGSGMNEGKYRGTIDTRGVVMCVSTHEQQSSWSPKRLKLWTWSSAFSNKFLGGPSCPFMTKLELDRWQPQPQACLESPRLHP